MALDQISESQTFKSTGIIKIGDLRFFPIDGTQAVLDARAQSLALQLDKYSGWFAALFTKRTLIN